MYGTIARAVLFCAVWLVICITAGCAVCERHPDACRIGAAVAGVAAGFVILESVHGAGGSTGPRTKVNPAPPGAQPPPCTYCTE